MCETFTSLEPGHILVPVSLACCCPPKRPMNASRPTTGWRLLQTVAGPSQRGSRAEPGINQIPDTPEYPLRVDSPAVSTPPPGASLVVLSALQIGRPEKRSLSGLDLRTIIVRCSECGRMM